MTQFSSSYWKLQLLSTLLLFIAAQSKMRYRSGTISCQEDLLSSEQSITVHHARQRCRSLPECTSFSFESLLTKVPADPVTVHFYSNADWHVSSEGQPCFVETPQWHTYINSTREAARVPFELDRMFDLWKVLDGAAAAVGSSPKLRSSSRKSPALPNSEDQKMDLISSFFQIGLSHPVLSAKKLTPWALALAEDESQDLAMRDVSLAILIVLGDSTETGHMLLPVYEPIRRLVETSVPLRKSALDVLSNLCIHQSVNDRLLQLGAKAFLESLLSEEGFIGVQSAIALTHLSSENMELPEKTLQVLVDLVATTLDGDIAFDIKWELVPGPLSSLQHYLDGSPEKAEVALDAGIMDVMLRVLSESSDPMELISALAILTSISETSERGRNILWLSEHALHEGHERLQKFTKAAELASDLGSMLESMDSSRREL